MKPNSAFRLQYTQSMREYGRSPIRTQTIRSVFSPTGREKASFANPQPGSILDLLQQKIAQERTTQAYFASKSSSQKAVSQQYAERQRMSAVDTQASTKNYNCRAKELYVVRKISLSIPQKVKRQEKRVIPSPELQPEAPLDYQPGVFPINQERVVQSIERISSFLDLEESQGSNYNQLQDYLNHAYKALLKMSRSAEHDEFLGPLVVYMQKDICVAQQYLVKKKTYPAVNYEVSYSYLSPTRKRAVEYPPSFAKRAESPCKMIYTEVAEYSVVGLYCEIQQIDRETETSPLAIYATECAATEVQKQPVSLFSEEDIKREIQAQISKFIAENVLPLQYDTYRSSAKQEYDVQPIIYTNSEIQSERSESDHQDVKIFTAVVSKRKDIALNKKYSLEDQLASPEVFYPKKYVVKQPINEHEDVDITQAKSVRSTSNLGESCDFKTESIILTPTAKKVPLDEFLDTKKDDIQCYITAVEQKEEKQELPKKVEDSNTNSITILPEDTMINSVEEQQCILENSALYQQYHEELLQQSDAAIENGEIKVLDDYTQPEIYHSAYLVQEIVNETEGTEQLQAATTTLLQEGVQDKVDNEEAESGLTRAEALLEVTYQKTVSAAEKALVTGTSPEKKTKKVRNVKKPGAGKAKAKKDLVDNLDVLEEMHLEEAHFENAGAIIVSSNESNADYQQKESIDDFGYKQFEQVKESPKPKSDSSKLESYRAQLDAISQTFVGPANAPLYVAPVKDYYQAASEIVEFIYKADRSIIYKFSSLQIDLVLQALQRHEVYVKCANDITVADFVGLRDIIELGDFYSTRFISSNLLKNKGAIDTQQVFSVIAQDFAYFGATGEASSYACCDVAEQLESVIHAIGETNRKAYLNDLGDYIVNHIVDEVVQLFV